MVEVIIGIPTCKRPVMLEKALRAVALQETDASIRILVADNDPIGKAGALLVDVLRREGFRYPISALIVPEQGISHARNALVNATLSDSSAEFLAFMDDDQIPEPHWLQALLEMQKLTNADVVASAVPPLFEGDPKAWVRECSAYQRDTSTNGPVPIVFGTGGVLLSTRLQARIAAPWFDPLFNLIGGGDQEFFLRLRSAGATFARAKFSRIAEVYPESRMRLRWVLRRAYRIGSTDVLIALQRRTLLSVLAGEFFKIAGAIALSPVLVVINVGKPGRQVDALSKAWRAFGKIAALCGNKYQEYAKIHGA